MQNQINPKKYLFNLPGEFIYNTSVLEDSNGRVSVDLQKNYKNKSEHKYQSFFMPKHQNTRG